MFFHAGFDSPLAGWDLAAEMCDIGSACLQHRPRFRAHFLRKGSRDRQQQDGGSRHDLV